MSTTSTSTAAREQGTLKWFNETKGYGFIAPLDGSKDVFVHISAVEDSGLDPRALSDGIEIEYTLEQARDGRNLAIGLKLLTQKKSATMDMAAEFEQGRVKWYDTSKGFGFITPEGGGEDVYVNDRILEKNRIQALNDGQTVQFIAIQGKGNRRSVTKLKV